MGKKSKLTEKASRMPQVREATRELAINTYLREIAPINSEPGRSQRFTLLLQGLFGVQPNFIEEYVQGIEKYLKIKQKDRILRGRADQLSGSLIIEFESNLNAAKREDAEEQLRRYTACVWSQEAQDQRTKFVCLATDGIRFVAYAPIAKGAPKPHLEPEEISLKVLEDLEAAKVKWGDFYFFLDRYLLRKEILHPTSEHITKDFGPNSHAFQVAEAELLALWDRLKQHAQFDVLYDAWEKYLRIVYGSSLGDNELFVRHTYLATLAKLMVWRRLATSQNHATDADILGILEGSYFRDQLAIENFLEEDFFSWVARQEAKDTAVAVCRQLLQLLGNYNLRELSEDVLKSLYEGLVDPATRHDLGEYYTPDWLAHRMVRRLLQPDPRAKVLDPACGSGTFLYMAIREKRRLLDDSVETLKHILGAVVGIDIHPLACIVAKANYVLALGDLMMRRKRRVAVPVYTANSVRPPTQPEATMLYRVKCSRTIIDGHEVHIPESLISEPEKYDEAIEAARDFALHHKGRRVAPDDFANFLKAHYPDLVDNAGSAQVLFTVAETLKEMLENGRDTIWAFVLKNIYKPLFLKEGFDVVLGNPPWLSYRHVERSDYKKFLKAAITKHYGLVEKRPELITHLELGTLFLLRAADLYLKSGGRIGFVLPKSIFSADQHDALRRGAFKHVSLSPLQLWDLAEVSPLFNISASVYLAQKTDRELKGAIPGEVLRGQLPTRNAALEAAESALSCESVNFSLSVMGKSSFWTSGAASERAESPYRQLFSAGATIFPRCFWFVDVKASEELGFDESLPPLISSQRAQQEAKPAYKGCIIEGTVESRFLYTTLLPVDMLPFGHLRLRLVVLPIAPRDHGYSLYAADKARSEGFVHLARWLEKVEDEWRRRAGTKAETLSALRRLDYRKDLTQQNPKASFRTIYATSGTHVCACALPSEAVRAAPNRAVRPNGFAADYTTYCLEGSSAQESDYLACFLNSPRVDSAIKDAQAKGLWGARHVCKKVLDLPIPQFDATDKRHIELAEMGKGCAERVQEWIASAGPGKIKSIGVLRGRVRDMLAAELAQIDAIVKPMLGL